MDTIEKTLSPQKGAVIFIGLQASGKSAFFGERFAATHVRISLDELNTRGKEQRLLEQCIADGKPFVVDNTNPTAADRARYIALAGKAGYRIVGVVFRSSLKECLKRNKKREGKARVPDIAIAATAAKMEETDLKEGFDEIYDVYLKDGEFSLEKREGH